MLVLSRKKDEEIVIVDDAGKIIAHFSIVKIEGQKVRIGIEADKQVKILRGELMKGDDQSLKQLTD